MRAKNTKTRGVASMESSSSLIFERRPIDPDHYDDLIAIRLAAYTLCNELSKTHPELAAGETAKRLATVIHTSFHRERK